MTETPAPTSKRPDPTSPCPCGSGQAFVSCCEPLLKGVSKASNAEQLMRSRYTAHAVEDFEYLHYTYVPTCDTPYEEEEYESTIKWTKLVIHSHDPDVRPGISHVDFSAYFSEKDREGAMHEKSEFILRDGSWLFNRPLREGPAPVKAGPKVGRNDPCPCGSGKKYKKCCG